MNEAATQSEDLTSLEGIRAAFMGRFKAGGVGYHALGEQVLQVYLGSEEQKPRPASAMTFRNFLQGRTNLRDPTGLLLYFEALGANHEEMRRIRSALQQEVDRKLATPAQDQALRAFQDTELADMPYSRALAECEAATRFERSIAAPIASVTPTSYLLGRDGPGGKDDPRNWGLLQHCEAMHRFMEALELRLQDEFAEVAPGDTKRRRWLAAAGVRETGTAYVSYLIAYPEQAELLMSHRRYLLQGPMPERERLQAAEVVQSLVQSLYHAFERFAQEVVLGGDKKRLSRTPDGEISLEAAGNRLFGIGMMFYVTTVIGSSGTGAFFSASQRARREFASEPLNGPPTWSESHETLVGSHAKTLAEASRMLDANPRVRYGELKDLFSEQKLSVEPHMLNIWEQDYAGTFIRESGVLMASELHTRGLMSNSALNAFFKSFLTSSEGQRLQQARFATRQFTVPPRPR